jgi:protein ImuA
MPLSITPLPHADNSRGLLLDSLRRRMEQMDGGCRQHEEVISTSCLLLDELLPRGGLQRGTLVEWLAEHPGSGAGMLALSVARQCSEGRALVVMDRARRFYPPSVVSWGMDLENLLVLRPRTESEELWALEQVLRSPSVGAVWAPQGRIDVREFRRLQLAAENGGAVGMLVRPADVRGEPSWAEAQFLVRPRDSPAGWRLNVEVTRSRGGTSGRSVELEINYQTGMAQRVIESHDAHPLHPFAELARPAVSG